MHRLWLDGNARLAMVLIALTLTGTRQTARAQNAGAATPTDVAKADALFAAQKWEKAAGAYAVVTKSNPKSPRAWFRLGYCLHAAGRIAEAIPAHKKAAEFPAVRTVALYNLGCAYALNKQSDEAFGALAKALDAGFNNRGQLDADTDLKSLHEDARFKKLLGRLDGAILPPERQFDFWVGRWDAVNKQGRKLGVNVIEKHAKGYMILENWTSASGGTGKSTNYYDRQAGKWRQIWVSDTGVVSTFEGGFRDGAMRLEGVSVLRDGRTHKARIRLTPKPDGTVHHLSQQSRDGGKTWKVYFDGTYVPQKTARAGGGDASRAATDPRPGP